MVGLALRLLGEFEARDNAGRLVTIGARKTRALLAVLALASSNWVLRDRICRLLWSDRADEQARSSLRRPWRPCGRILLRLAGCRWLRPTAGSSSIRT